MRHKLNALVIATLLASPCANATLIRDGSDSSSTHWLESFGSFTYFAGGLLGGGTTNQMSADYDAATEIFRLSSTFLPHFRGPGQTEGNIAFSFTTSVSNTGVFRGGGSYSMMVGSSGINGLGLAAGTLLLSGSVLDIDSAWTEVPGGSPGCSPIRTSCFQSVSNGWTPALVSVDYAAPELSIASQYLTIIPYLFPLQDVENPWSNSFHGSGGQGWTLFASNQIPVPEPQSLWLFAIGLIGVAHMRRRKID